MGGARGVNRLCICLFCAAGKSYKTGSDFDGIYE